MKEAFSCQKKFDIPCKLAIFDLDGTILDTLDDLAASTNYALASQGLAPCSREEVRQFVGNGIRNLIVRAVCQASGSPCIQRMSAETAGTVPADSGRTDDASCVPVGSAAKNAGAGASSAEAVLVCTPADASLLPLIQAVHQAFTAHYREHCADRTRPYPGITEALGALRARSVKTAVVSNKADYGVQELVERYFPGLFDYAVGEREGIRRKPAPDSVLAVLARFGISKEEAVYIGDSDVDIATARNAGLPCISVTWGFRSEDFLREQGATRLLHDPAELVAALS